jgi:hypothetical protein
MGIISTVLVIISVEYKACIVCMCVSTRISINNLIFRSKNTRIFARVKIGLFSTSTLN